MNIIFCNNLLEPNKVDEDFEAEYKAARKADLQIHLISLESLRDGNIADALKRIKTFPNKQLAVYRGWMLQENEYKHLYEGLISKNIQLINSPLQYINCHHFPNSYQQIKAFTPASVFFEVSGKINFDELHEKLKVFADKPVIVKDYVKSEKYYWKEACFISKSSDHEAVERVTNKFLELRGKYLNKGLVFREFIDLTYLPDHSKGSLPLAKEFRLFYVYGKLLACTAYWNEGKYDEEKPDVSVFNHIAHSIESNFFTMDIAKQATGAWVIMELGDGQVSGLPDNLDKDIFYQSLKSHSKE